MDPQSPSEPINPQQAQTSQPPIVEQEKTNHNKLILIVVGILVLLTVVFGIYYFIQLNKQSTTSLPAAQITPQPTTAPQPTLEQPSPTTLVDETKEWKTYTNSKYNYTLEYPPEWEPATCGYAETETGVIRDLIPEQLDNVEFHEIGWDCPPTDAPWPNFGIYIKDDKPTEPQFFPPVLSGTNRAIEQKPDRQIGDKLYFVYWIVKKEPNPGVDNQIMYYHKNNGKIYSFQIFSQNDIPTLDKILSTFRFQ